MKTATKSTKPATATTKATERKLSEPLKSAPEGFDIISSLCGIISEVGTLGIQNRIMIEGVIAEATNNSFEGEHLKALRSWSIELSIATTELVDAFNKEHERWQAFRASEEKARVEISTVN